MDGHPLSQEMADLGEPGRGVFSGSGDETGILVIQLRKSFFRRFRISERDLEIRPQKIGRAHV